MFIGGNFLNIVLTEWDFLCDYSSHILIKTDFRNETVRRNYSTVCRLYILRRKQSETNREILIIVSDSEQLVVLHNLRK